MNLFGTITKTCGGGGSVGSGESSHTPLWYPRVVCRALYYLQFGAEFGGCRVRSDFFSGPLVFPLIKVPTFYVIG